MKTLNDIYIEADLKTRAEIDSYFDTLYNAVQSIVSDMEQTYDVTCGPHLKAFLLDMERVIGKDLVRYE